MKHTDGRADGGPTDKKGRKQGLERQRAGNKDQDGKGPETGTGKHKDRNGPEQGPQQFPKAKARKGPESHSGPRPGRPKQDQNRDPTGTGKGPEQLYFLYCGLRLGLAQAHMLDRWDSARSHRPRPIFAETGLVTTLSCKLPKHVQNGWGRSATLARWSRACLDHARIGPAVELTAQAVAVFEGRRFFLSRFLGFGASQVIFWFSQIVSKPYHTFFSFGDESRI